MSDPRARLRTGIAGLDDVLYGGLTPNRLYLLEGKPGSGKTTLALQFLLEGVRNREPVLYVTLSETAEEITAVADSHGWTLDGIHVRELMPAEELLNPNAQYTVFHPSEVELSETTKKILSDVDVVKPRRIVLDSLSEVRLLSGNALRYRRQILALKQYFIGRECTVMMLDDLTSHDNDLQVQSITHGAILLEHALPTFGKVRRRLHVTKYRGSDFRGGFHDYVIERGGLRVFPRLVAAEHRHSSSRERLRSNIAGLDSLMGGGLERGTSTLVQGAAGTGKSTIAALFAASAAERGERTAMFIFDESKNTLFSRMAGLGVDLRQYDENGTITVTQIDPAEMSPGELASVVRASVDQGGASIVVIDSLNGYLQSMPDENFLIVQLHEMLSYLGQLGVASLLVSAQQGLMGTQMTSPVDVSYLADTVVMLRYYEDRGEVKQAVSVVKMRGGQHERTIREFRMHDGRVTVGEPLRNYRGVLSGIPVRIEQE
jgi:circadian clock protein KaiC